jgi:hypothetical protein
MVVVLEAQEETQVLKVVQVPLVVVLEMQDQTKEQEVLEYQAKEIKEDKLIQETLVAEVALEVLAEMHRVETEEVVLQVL